MRASVEYLCLCLFSSLHKYILLPLFIGKEIEANIWKATKYLTEYAPIHFHPLLLACGPLGCSNHLGTALQWPWGSWSLFDRLISIHQLGKIVIAAWLDQMEITFCRRLHPVFHRAPLVYIPASCDSIPFPPHPHQNILSSLSQIKVIPRAWHGISQWFHSAFPKDTEPQRDFVT